MNFSATPQKNIRFDIDPDYLRFKTLSCKIKITHKESIGMGNIAHWIEIKWRVQIFDITSKNEILGLLTEDRKTIEAENKEKDLGDLRTFAYNSFLNVEMYIEDNLPKSWAHFQLPKVDYDKIAENLLDLVADIGIYDEK